jgi:hypothetical protein
MDALLGLSSASRSFDKLVIFFFISSFYVQQTYNPTTQPQKNQPTLKKNKGFLQPKQTNNNKGERRKEGRRKRSCWIYLTSNKRTILFCFVRFFFITNFVETIE